MREFIFSLLLLGAISGLQAQEFGFGIKAGLSFSTFQGDQADGESFGYKSGFHVGPSFSLRFTDFFSVRAEFLYNQLGTDYEFNGPSYFVLRDVNGTRREVYGDKDLRANYFLNYFDIPLQVAFKLGSTIELFAGVNFLILPGATGGGSVDFTTTSGEEISTSLEYSYNGDDAASGADSDFTSVRIGGRIYDLPDRLGAYYDFEEKDGRAWNTFDYGLHGGGRVFFNDALYLAARVYYGLSDITNNDLDYRQDIETGQDLELSDDVDTNLSIQVSLGFSF
jgi:hypothetical protein